MNEFQVKQSTFTRGFEFRLQQLITKEAAQREMEKNAFGAAARLAGRAIGGGARMMGRALGGGAQMAGRGLGALERMPTLSEAVESGVGAARRGTGNLSEQFHTGLGHGMAPHNFPSGAEFEAARAAETARAPAAGGAPAMSAGGAAGGGGSAGGGAGFDEYSGGFGGGVDPNVAIPSGMWGRYKNWANMNPGLSTAATVGGGMAAAKGMDMYGAHRRRQAIENLPFFPRLMLAGQMAFNPRGAIDSMGL